MNLHFHLQSIAQAAFITHSLTEVSQHSCVSGTAILVTFSCRAIFSLLKDSRAHYEPHMVTVAKASFEFSAAWRVWQPKGTARRDMFVRLPFGALRV